MGATTPNKMQYRDLSPKVQKLIDGIFWHRFGVRVYTALGTGVGLLPVVPLTIAINTSGLASEATKNWYSTPWPYLWPVATAVVGASLLSDHGKDYSKEERDLYRALRDSRDRRVRNLLGRFPYVVVDRHGNLVGKRTNPRLWFVPIGRRRIPTPMKRRELIKKQRAKRWGPSRSRIHKLR